MKMDIHSLPCIFFSHDDNGIIVQVNAMLCDKLGYAPEELVGAKVETIFTVATKIFQQTHFFPLLRMHGFAEEIYITLQTKTGHELPVLINAKRITEGKEVLNVHTGIIVLNRNKFEEELIAARKTAEKALLEKSELVRIRSELQQHIEDLERYIHIINKKNEELTQFNKVVTHDIQEPIRKLFLFSNMLYNEEDRNEQLELHERLKNAAGKMQDIISGLQQYIWLTDTSLKTEMLDLKVLLSRIDVQLKLEHPGVNFQLKYSDIPLFEGDRNQIELLFYKLIENSMNYRQEGVEPVIEVSAVILSQNIFRNIKDKYRYEEMVRIEVADNGRGFDERFKHQAFELFKGLHADSKKGIGLSLSKKIVENHNGSINIRSQVNKGTIVSVLLPIQIKPNEQ